MNNIKQFKNSNFELYAPDSLRYITSDLEDILNNSLDFYKKLFDVDSFRCVQINYFDNIDDFKRFIISIRGEDNLPKYAKATFDKGMINAFIESNLIEGTPLYNKRKYLASHELFHIMYKELIWDKKYPRVTWLDEGMAQYFSLEFEKEMNQNFDVWFNKLIEKTKTVPNLNELTHENGFETSEYSGYKLSLLSIKYLVDSLGIDELKRIINSYDMIIEIGNDIAQKALDYYYSLSKNSRKEQ